MPLIEVDYSLLFNFLNNSELKKWKVVDDDIIVYQTMNVYLYITRRICRTINPAYRVRLKPTTGSICKTEFETTCERFTLRIESRKLFKIVDSLFKNVFKQKNRNDIECFQKMVQQLNNDVK